MNSKHSYNIARREGEWSGLLTLSNDGIYRTFYVVNGLVKTRLLDGLASIK